VSKVVLPRLDERGPRRSTRECPRYGREVPVLRLRFKDLRVIGWAQPRPVVKIVNWCGHSQQFVPWPEAEGY